MDIIIVPTNKLILPKEALDALPDWGPEELGHWPPYIPDLEDQVRRSIRLSFINVERKTGGPFGAIIVERDTGKVVGVGVNRVVPLNDPTAHAEMNAIRCACKVVRSYSLGKSTGQVPHRLTTSTITCAMCFGGIIWAELDEMVSAATKAHAESIGFFEGPIHPDYREEGFKCGLKIREGVLSEEAHEVHRLYAGNGGLLYNGKTPL